VAENQELLERAIEVQTRIVRIIARAVVPVLVDGRYGSPHAKQPAARVPAIAISTQA
jgi:hypothetical protein